MFKKDFLIFNQVARQNAKTSMEKKFYKLMNNPNFGYDCRNNFDNRYFTPVIDEIEEMGFIRKHQDVFDSEIASYFSTDHLVIQINDDFDNKLANLQMKQDEFFEAKINSLEIERKKS